MLIGERKHFYLIESLIFCYFFTLILFVTKHILIIENTFSPLTF